MAHSHVAGTAVFAGASPITANPPGGAGSDQTGKLLLFICETTANGSSVSSPPSGYTRIDGLTELAAFYKHGGASEPAASVSFTGTAAGGAQIIAFTSDTGSWASGASVLAGYAERSPANGNELPYAAMTKVADGALRVRVAGKNGNTTGITITSVATTSGYTQCAFVENDNSVAGMCLAAEYQNVSADAVDTDAVITTWAVSRPRRGVTIEFVPAVTGPEVTADDGTVQIGEAALDPAVAPGTELLTATPAFDGPITEVYII